MRYRWQNKSKPAFRWGMRAAVLLLSILLSLPSLGAPASGSDLDQAYLEAKGSVISNTLEVTITAKPAPQPPGGGGSDGGGGSGGGRREQPGEKAPEGETQPRQEVDPGSITKAVADDGTTVFTVKGDGFEAVKAGQVAVINASDAAPGKDVVVSVAAGGLETLAAKGNTGLEIATPHGSVRFDSSFLQAAATVGRDLTITAKKAGLPEPRAEGRYIGSDAVEISTNIKGKAEVYLPLHGVDLEGINLNRLGAWVVHEDGSEEFVPAVVEYDAAGNPVTAVIRVNRLSVFALMEYLKTFADVQNHWARESIEIMAARQVVKGMGDNAFNPDAVITRAQFCAFIIRALDMDEYIPDEPNFADVSKENWYYGAVEAAYKAGLVSGVGGGKFAPEAEITRETVTAMVAKALERSGLNVVFSEYETASLLERFKDKDEISEWARQGVAVCVQKGIISGRTAQEFVPGEYATRAEGAVVMHRLLKELRILK